MNYNIQWQGNRPQFLFLKPKSSQALYCYLVKNYTFLVELNIFIAFLNLVRYIFKVASFDIQGFGVLQLPGKRYSITRDYKFY
jgi:hypothetical protein